MKIYECLSNFNLTIMKKQLLLIVITLLHVFYACSENFELDKQYPDYKSWKEYSDSQQFFSFVSFSPGEYRYHINTKNPRTKGKVEVKIEALDLSSDFSPLKKSFELQAFEDAYLDFSIYKDGYYKLTLKLLDSGDTSIPEDPYIEIKRGKARFAENENAPTVFLNFLSEEKMIPDYEWIHGELTIPKELDVPYTSVNIGYNNIEMGVSNYINNNKLLELITGSFQGKMVVFKIGKEQENASLNVELIGKGGKVRFEQSSESHKTAYLNYDWSTDAPIKFLLNRKKQNDNTVYSVWFADKGTPQWTYIASFNVTGENESGKNFYSVLSNDSPLTGYSKREAIFSNIWTKTANEDWKNINKAEFKADANPSDRSDYGGGLVNGNPQKFFLTSGGFYKNTDIPSDIIIAEKSQTWPDVGINTRNSFVEEVLKSGYTESWGYEPDTKIKVVSGKTSDYQYGEGIEKSFDGNFLTIYHSSWGNTRFPVTLDYHFSEKDTIDYLVYYPRSDGGQNGIFKELELWVSGKDDVFKKIGDYDFEGKSQPNKIEFSNPLIHPKIIRFIVKTGAGDGDGFASCAEMEFCKKTAANQAPSIFTDFTCSELKNNIRLQEIETLKIKEYRELAKSLYDKTYPTKERVRYYAPYPDPRKAAEKNKTASYSLLDNPTGIFVDKDQDIVIFVGDTGNENVSLRSINLDKGFAACDYLLQEGLNKIQALDKGLLYVMYHTENKSAKPIKIHIATGDINNFFDITKNNNDEWKPMLDNAACDYMDVLGKYAHLTFSVDDFKRYTPDIERLIAVYDSIVWLESELIGLNKYNRQNKNQMYFYLDPVTPYGGYAIDTRTGYCKGFMREMCQPHLLRSSGIWGPAHEVGHMNQTRPGFKWVGMTEVSNNVYAMFVQQSFGNQSRLAIEKLNSDFDGVWNNRYEKGFTEMIAEGIPFMKHGDVFCRLIPFWQLQLYNADIKGQKDFYADVHEQIRINPDPETDSEAQLQFMKICCDAAKTDFTDFFEKWGLLAVIDENVSDHSSIPNQVYGRKDFTITQQQVNDLKKYAGKYKKPDVNIHYIHDECISTFKNNAKIKQGTFEKSNDTIQMIDWENVIVYEIYDNGKLVLVTPFSSFKIPAGSSNVTINAIPIKGKPIIVKL